MKRFVSTSARARFGEVYVVSAARTPFGSFLGSLSKYTSTKLGSIAIQKAVEKANIDKSKVQEVFMGCVLQGGVGQAPARQAALGAGLDSSTPCTTVNKVCASGMKSIMLATTSLALGLKDVMVAGGMESISNSPYYFARGNAGNIPYGRLTLLDSCEHDGLTDVGSNWHMGKCAEHTVEKMSIEREDQDAYAVRSYRLHREAQAQGIFDKEIVHITDVLSKDEEASKDPEALLGLPTKWGATITPGSSSKLADGASACVLMNEKGLEETGAQPIARIVDFEDSAQEPIDWPTSPAAGIKRLLARHGIENKSISMWEVNEAFAMVVLANARILGIDTSRVNLHGGAISMGHPFGASGSRITNHLALNLKESELGVASLCNGGGGASSILLQGLAKN